MRKVRTVMQVVIALSAFLLVLILGIQSYDWFRLNGHYERIFTRMSLAYMEGENVEQIRSDLAYANATANMKLNDLKSLFFKGVTGVLALVFSYIPVHFFAKEDPPKLKKKTAEAIPYMDKEEGEVLFDDRSGVQ